MGESLISRQFRFLQEEDVGRLTLYKVNEPGGTLDFNANTINVPRSDAKTITTIYRGEGSSTTNKGGVNSGKRGSPLHIFQLPFSLIDSSIPEGLFRGREIKGVPF